MYYLARMHYIMIEENYSKDIYNGTKDFCFK